MTKQHTLDAWAEFLESLTPGELELLIEKLHALCSQGERKKRG